MPTLRLPRLGCSISVWRFGSSDDAAHVEKAALRIAAHRMLDLDDVRAPVGEDRAGGGHERELRHLEDPNPFHHLRHIVPRLAFAIWRAIIHRRVMRLASR